MAAQKGHSDTVSILLQANANPNIQSDEGVTPLYVAAQNGHSDTVSILLQAILPIPIFKAMKVSRLCTSQSRMVTLIQSVFFYKQMPIPTA